MIDNGEKELCRYFVVKPVRERWLLADQGGVGMEMLQVVFIKEGKAMVML